MDYFLQYDPKCILYIFKWNKVIKFLVVEKPPAEEALGDTSSFIVESFSFLVVFGIFSNLCVWYSWQFCSAFPQGSNLGLFNNYGQGVNVLLYCKQYVEVICLMDLSRNMAGKRHCNGSGSVSIDYMSQVQLLQVFRCTIPIAIHALLWLLIASILPSPQLTSLIFLFKWTASFSHPPLPLLGPHAL